MAGLTVALAALRPVRIAACMVDYCHDCAESVA
jgi:hypothetical protein